MKKVGVILILFLSLNLVIAHQPRIVNTNPVIENPVIIKNPEISQAFYGELEGKEEHYKISEIVGFKLYVGILSPDIQGARTDFIVEVNNNVLLDGTNFTWTEFYEHFAGDSYLKGPEYEKDVEAGEYLIKVYNKDNRGKYVLVVGKEEKFPLNEAVNTVISLPKLKIYFNKPVITAFFNLVGLFLLILLIVSIAVVLAVYFLIRKIREVVFS